jgi:hypothetical protein
MTKIATAVIGACGEHYVASYLSRLGLIVALPRAGVPGCDLLVTHQSGGKSIRLQVKTGTDLPRKDKSVGLILLWRTSFKVIDANLDNLWFAYVWLKEDWPKNEGTCPEVFFIPACDVAATLSQCRDDGEGEWYWITVDGSKRYKGLNGFNLMSKSL